MRCLVCYWLDETYGTDGTLVGRGWYGGTGVSRRWNRSATIGAGTGTPPLALEGRRVVGGKLWLAPILSMLQCRGVFLSE